jgi:hypothetical protein
MQELLFLIRDPKEPISDFLRLNYDVWYLPPSNYGDDVDKFINQQLVTINPAMKRRLDVLFKLGSNSSYGLQQCKDMLGKT